MSRQFFAGGTYADATPAGAYAVCLPGKGTIATHQGDVPLPSGEDTLLFLRITTADGFQIAGKAHNSATTWHWHQGAWRALPDGAGVSPVIFDRLGILHISDGSIGSQGWRYVEDDGSAEGRLRTGDETYGSSFGLSEWSAYGGLYIGQGHDVGGVCVWDGTTLRLLESGPCTFVRVQGHGQSVAVAFQKPEGAVIYQTTVAELSALPPVAVVAPPLPVPEDDMVRPTIDVQHYDAQIKPGQAWQTDFVLGGQTTVTVRIGATGNLTISARNPAGADATGRLRHVEVG